MTSTSGSQPENDPPEIAPLYSAAAIGARVQALADEISARAPAGRGPLVLVGLLRGAVPFVSDLARALSERRVAVVVEYMSASSYAGRTSSGDVQLAGHANLDLAGRDCLIVDDILDTGLTLEAVLRVLKAKAPARLATVVLLDKTARRINELTAEFSGFRCPDVFVVGYGMDLDGRFRELPFIGTIASH